MASTWRFLLAMLAWCFVCTAAQAETRVLLVGVSHFASPMIPDLKGPDNDLAAMERLMRAQGATDVTVLRDAAVSRTAVETALHALGLRAKPGDWIIFYYSGHGAQAEAKVKGTRDGDYDQFVPLPGFDLATGDPERYIVDKDFYAWFARYVPASVQLMMIADTCHSGTLNRSADPRALRFAARLALRGREGEIRLAARPAPRFAGVRGAGEPVVRGAVDRADLANVIFLGAAQDGQLALEASMPAEGAPARGLLTYAFEQGLTTRAVDGRTLAADLDGDGRIQVGEITSYVDSQVRSLTGQRQQPRVSFATGRERAQLFATATSPPADAPRPPLPAIFPLDPTAAALLAGRAAPWRLATSADVADYWLDGAAGNLIRRSGDTVASDVTSAAVLGGAIEKWQAVETLRPFLNEARARVAVGPAVNGARYPPGSVLDVRLRVVGAAAGARATVFNLASDGTIQPLYPLAEHDADGPLDAPGGLPLVETMVVPPFGADHVVAVVSAGDPAELRGLVRALDGQRGAGKLTDAVKRLLAADAGHASLSIGEIYSGR